MFGFEPRKMPQKCTYMSSDHADFVPNPLSIDQIQVGNARRIFSCAFHILIWIFELVDRLQFTEREFRANISDIAVIFFSGRIAYYRRTFRAAIKECALVLFGVRSLLKKIAHNLSNTKQKTEIQNCIFTPPLNHAWKYIYLASLLILIQRIIFIRLLPGRWVAK